MIAAEESILKRGGTVLRLAGLYSNTKGPHTHWLYDKSKKEEAPDGDNNNLNLVDSAADGMLNMLHYDDAAACAQAVINRGRRGMVYLACDGNPISRKEICQVC